MLTSTCRHLGLIKWGQNALQRSAVRAEPGIIRPADRLACRLAGWPAAGPEFPMRVHAKKQLYGYTMRVRSSPAIAAYTTTIRQLYDNYTTTYTTTIRQLRIHSKSRFAQYKT